MDKEKSNEITGTSSTSNNSKDRSGKDKKYVFYRKPSLKKKAPEVKQTKTSMKRLLIANPLLKYDGVELPQIEKILTDGGGPTVPEKSFQKAIPNKDSKFKDPKLPIVNPKQRLNSILAGNSSDNKDKLSFATRISTSRQSVIDFNSSTQRVLSSTHCETKAVVAETKRSAKTDQEKKKDVIIKEKKTLRRSISAQHFNRKNGKC